MSEGAGSRAGGGPVRSGRLRAGASEDDAGPRALGNGGGGGRGSRYPDYWAGTGTQGSGHQPNTSPVFSRPS
jgi:hypothetical protein